MTLTRAPASTDTGEQSLASVAAAVTVVAWASAFVAIRYVGEQFAAGGLAFGRLLIGSAALGVLLLVRREWRRPSRREWVLLTVCGVAWFAIYNVALNAAEQQSGRDRRNALNALATQVDKDVAGAKDAERVKAMSAAIKALARATR